LETALESADVSCVLDFLAAEFPDVVGRTEGPRATEPGTPDQAEFAHEASG
jgi:hypothetical protein